MSFVLFILKGVIVSMENTMEFSQFGEYVFRYGSLSALVLLGLCWDWPLVCYNINKTIYFGREDLCDFRVHFNLVCFYISINLQVKLNLEDAEFDPGRLLPHVA